MTPKQHPPQTHAGFDAPNRREKATGDGPRLPDPEQVEAAAWIESFAAEYRSFAQNDLAKLKDALLAAQIETMDRTPHLQALQRVAHDMRGQGASFGYPLITHIADALCRYLGRPIDASAVDLTVCTVHVDALQAIIQHEITGDGGELGQNVVDGINRLVQTSVFRSDIG